MSCPHCGALLVSAVPLTRRQRELYEFLLSFSREHGYAPTFDEIADRFGYTSISTVSEHLGNLERKGYIKRGFGEARAITCLVNLDDGATPPLADLQDDMEGRN